MRSNSWKLHILPEEGKKKRKNEIRKKPQVTPRFSWDEQSLCVAQVTLGAEKSVSTEAASVRLHPDAPGPHFIYITTEASGKYHFVVLVNLFEGSIALRN